MRLFPVIILMLAASFCENGLAQVKSQKEVISIKCPVMPGRDAKPDLSLPFEGGQVYFCCKNCLGKFEANPEKYQKAAKQQLQMTAKKAKGQKQKIQSKAELSSRKIELEKLLKELADAVESGELTKEQVIGNELSEWWCVTDGKTKLQILNVELVDHPIENSVSPNSL